MQALMDVLSFINGPLPSRITGRFPRAMVWMLQWFLVIFIIGGSAAIILAVLMGTLELLSLIGDAV